MPARRKSVNVGTLKAETAPLKKGLRSVKSEVKSVQKIMSEFNRRMDRSTEVINRQKRQLHQLQRAYRRAGSSARQMTASLSSMTLGVVTTTTAVYALGRALSTGFREAIRFDRGLTLIKKTTKIADDDLKKLRSSLIDTSSFLGVDRNAVAAAAGVAGRLGIAELGQLEVLAEVASKLDRATNVDAARATQALAKVLTLTGRKAGNFANEMRAAGDSLVHLGNNAPIAEDQILNLSVSLAAVLGRFGAGPADVLATATALGIAEGQAQGAATAYQRLLTNISVLADEGGPRFDRFAWVMGRSTERLHKDLKTNITDVILDLLETLRQFDPVSQIRVLEHIGGLTDLRSQQALLKSIPHLVSTMNLSHNAKDALDIEDAIRRQRLSGQLDVNYQKLSNAVKEQTDLLTEGIVAYFVIARQILAAGTTSLTENIKRTLGGPASLAHKAMTAVTDGYLAAQGRSRADALAVRRGMDAETRRQLGSDVVRRIEGLMDKDGLVPGTRTQIPRATASSVVNLYRAGMDRHADRENIYGDAPIFGRDRTEEEYTRLFQRFTSEGMADFKKIRKTNLSLTGPAGASGLLSSAFTGDREFRVPKHEDDPMNEHQLRMLSVRVGRRLDEIVGPILAAGLPISGPAGNFGARGSRTLEYQRETGRLANAEGEAIAGRLEDRADAEALAKEEEARKREHALDMELLRREAQDERKLLAMVRKGETSDAVAHQEAVLELNRQYYWAREALTGDALDAELAKIERRREEMKKKDPKSEENKKLADVLTESVADVLREGGGIKDAWRGLMNELAAQLLEQQIMEPFKKAMSGLLNEVLSYLTQGSGRGGTDGLVDAAWGVITGRPSLPGPLGGPAGGPTPMARGGVVLGAGMALVGERGPELLSMPVGAAVAPLSGHTGPLAPQVNIHYTIYSEDDVAVERVIQRNMPQIADYTQRQLENRSRNNSSFAQTIRR